MRVAVLGAGLAGTCVALELAAAGLDVHLFDRAPQALSGASLGNEGKIHLGLVYANDASGRTARTMVRGAARFRPLLERWIDAADLVAMASTPFVYAMPRDSLLPPARIRAHFAEVGRLWSIAARQPGTRYLRDDLPPGWRERRVGGDDGLFDAREVTHVFESNECAIDTPMLCVRLRARLATEPGLIARYDTTIEAVHADPRGGYRVRFRHDDATGEEPFACVVNATWEQRLVLDAGLGLVPPGNVVHRYKVGLTSDDLGLAGRMPSVTFVLGPFGDTVGCPARAYASWYPAGLLRQEFGVAPDPAPIDLSPARRRELAAATLAGLRTLMPGATALGEDTLDRWQVTGGYITAWGRSGIEDAASELHERHAVGVHSDGAYHSIDTGKFTLAPLFAAEACARILQREARRA
jgi:glycine/D-amino acid oxidase-like deaminating enzyme